MIKFILLLLISFPTFASRRDEAQELLTRYDQGQETIKRLDLFSSAFIGLPYGDGGPLGEGEKARYDQDPLYRFDTFDCTTFVETVMGLSLSTTVDDFEKKMDEIRYENGDVDYLKRNHFPSLQWIPYNVQNGVMKEINDLVLPPSEQLVAEAVINLPGWLKAIKIEEIRVPLATLSERQILLEELQARSADYSPVIARLNYLPIATLIKNQSLLKKIPHGSVVNFVRPNWDLTDVIGTHMNVSHQGLIFHMNGVVTLRHASSTGDKKVMNMPLIDYLKKFENHATMKGIHIMQVNPL